jgi:hypothetical protein
MKPRSLGFDEHFVGLVGYNDAHYKQPLPSCEQGGKCSSSVCEVCNGTRHRLAQAIEPMLPGLEVQFELPLGI